MTAHYSARRREPNWLECDDFLCSATFIGAPHDYVALVRARARLMGWQCWNPGPKRPARDLCPAHREDPS